MLNNKLILVENGEIIDKFALADSSNTEIVIGRASVCDVRIENQSVSSKHVSILQEANNKLLIIDLNSSNGTFVNNIRIESGIGFPIVEGDVITLGKGGDIQLFVEQFAKENTEFKSKDIIIVGRHSSCDIVLSDRSVSSRHCEIRKRGSEYWLKDLGSTNGTFVNGSAISDEIVILKSDNISVGNETFKLGDYINGRSASRVNTKQLSPINILKSKETVIIGRDSTADIIIDDNVISRKHARITVKNGSYYIEDLKSTNGTFVNGEQIKGVVRLNEKDEIRLGFNILNLLQGESDASTMVAIKAVGVSKKYSNGYVGLQPMNIEIPTKSFVALMGPSGCGKTTLLNILNGANPSTTGSVSVHGLDLKQYYSLIKQKIGYVPQDDIVHKDLSVDDSLYYAAKLRMNEDTTDDEIKRRIDQVLSSLNINDNEIRKNQIKELSGGQRKRISIAVELLNRPSILFLDEPTSPLDPETIEEFLGVLKNLTITEGTTIVMVTHKPEDLNFVDKVLFLANKGHIAYYGDVKSVYSYFNVGEKSINKIYALMSDFKEAEKWYAKWMNHSKRSTAMPYSESKEAKQYSYSSLRQYYWLTRRYFHIKLNDKLNLILLFAQPIIIALLLALIFDKFEVGVIFLMTISAIWFGVSNSAKEIVDEVPIYTRERMFNLKIIPYLFSKISVLSMIALIQVSLFVIIVSIRYASDDISISNEIHYISMMFLLSFSATLLGLLLSTMFKSAEKVMTVVPIALLPQIMLSGVITSLNTGLKDLLSYFTLGRWGTEALSRIQNISGDYQKITEKVFYVTNRSNDGIYVDTIQKSELLNISVMRSIPNMHIAKDTLVSNGFSELTIPYQYQIGTVSEKANPMEILNFYNSHTLGVFNSLSLNIIAISTISVITFIAIVYLLNRKDSIKIN